MDPAISKTPLLGAPPTDPESPARTQPPQAQAHMPRPQPQPAQPQQSQQPQPSQQSQQSQKSQKSPQSPQSQQSQSARDGQQQQQQQQQQRPNIKLLSGNFSASVNPKSFRVEQKYPLHKQQHVIVARSKRNPSECVAMRLRVGRGGYSQWLNELHVYLLPNFAHHNVLPFLGCDKTSLLRADECSFNSESLLDETENEPYMTTSASLTDSLESGQPAAAAAAGAEEERKRRQQKARAANIKHPTVDYWILNDFSGCITLRHYLMMHTISWSQLIAIAQGIMKGLHYLHENAEYQHSEASSKQAVDDFIRSTGGALKRVSFRDLGHCIYMTPPLFITIIHRNLSSLNIVLRNDFTPCIWNFGYAYVYHPFQPINYNHLVDKPIKTIHMTSPYSPPEVLSERGLFTLSAMKSIDMYAAGIIMWELMTRCVLPKLKDATIEEDRERSDPEPYQAPFEREFRCSNEQIRPMMLKHAVCRIRARPHIKRCWLTGKKTTSMLQTIRELWDQDSEARIHTSTVLERLARTSANDHDRRYRHQFLPEREFILERMWPPEMECTMAPIITNKCDSTMVVEDLRAKPRVKSASERLASSTGSSSPGLMSM